MVNPDWPRPGARLPTVTTAPVNRLYAHIFPILVRDRHPIGSGTIHPQQVPEMKKTLRVLAVAIALSSAALALHYLIGSMSY